MSRPIIIDTDPGQDDAIGILLALASSEELDLLELSSSLAMFHWTEQNAMHGRYVNLRENPKHRCRQAAHIHLFVLW